MSTIETYQDDGSAMSRLHLWHISLRIAELHPVNRRFQGHILADCDE
jgi:hypothetical protein